ncbi:MAG: hypothetical protein GTO41_02860, partial [Burkholderiales bacterium]|nr:hypothetical protein [Burkholderiales bacterium]
MSNIPALPVVVKPMKDAARAAKVSARWAMHRIKEMTVTYLLDLPQFIVTGYWLERRGEQEIVHLYCMHREEVAICPRCHQVSMTYHDGKERCVRDLDVWGKCTFLHFISRRFDCERCTRPFTEKLACIDRQRRQTRRFEQHIYRRCLS